MNLPRLLIATSLAAFAAGCSPLNSTGSLFATGRDARSFNAATGRYEWSDPGPARPPSPSPRAATTRRPSATPAPSGEGRAYNLEKGHYE